MNARRRGASRALAMVAVVLAATTLFGVWHVVVGGVINGNGRAAGFGAADAAVAGFLLAVTLVVHRLLRA
jgi:hypothetical protein